MRRALFLLFAVAGCGGGSGTQTQGASIQGSWRGVFYEPQTTVHGSVALTVAGSSVSGSTDPTQGPDGSFSLVLAGQAATGSADLPGIGSGPVTGEVYPETPEALRLVVAFTMPDGRQVSMSLARP